MTENDWLEAKNLGVLELTCKSARTTICTDEVWEALCLRRWPNTKRFKRNFMGRLGGHRGLYRRRTSKQSLPEQSPPEEQLPPPTLKAKDLRFLIDIRANGKSIISTAVAGDHIGIDKEDSTVALKGGSNFKAKTIGSVEYVLGTTNEIQIANEFFSNDYVVEVQMITPSRTVVITPNVHCWFDRRGVVNTHANNGSNVCPKFEGDNICDISSCRLRSTLLGSAIKQRLRGEFSFLVYPMARFVDERKNLVVDSFQIDLRVGKAMFDKKVQDETGVGLLHVLENLEGSPLGS